MNKHYLILKTSLISSLKRSTFFKFSSDLTIFRTLLILLLILAITPLLVADPEVDNNAGTWTDNFNDQLGTVVANSSSIEFDVFAGNVSLISGQASGIQESVIISPPSFDSWQLICLDANYSGANDLTVTVLDAATDTPISGYTALPIGDFTDGCYDISGIDVNAFPELKIQINHTRGSTAPVVNQLQVTWNPRTFLLFDKIAPATILAGQEFRYKVRVSANFVDADNVVIYDVLPATVNGTVIYEPGEDNGQSDDPVVNQISDDGIYTATGTTVNGITIPPNSVYWTFDKIMAGVSKVLQLYVRSPNGTMDGTIWENTAEVFVSNGDNKSAAPVQTTILSSPSPSVSKASSTLGNPSANKIYPIQGTNYVIGGETITYRISASNSYASEGRERMHDVVLWDNLSELVDNGLISGAPFDISGGGIYTTTAITVSGTDIPANSIYWDKGTFGPGDSADESFKVTIVPVPPVQSFTNFASLGSEQTNTVSDNLAVTPVDSGAGAGLPGSGCNGCKLGYFSSYSSGEQDRNCGGADGGVPMNFDDPLQYRYSYSNCGGGELEEIVFYDMVPQETRFVNASFIDPTGLLTGSIYYYEELTGTFTDNTSPPPFDWTNPESGGWSSTKPTDNDSPSQTIWVAWHVEGITSPYTDADPTRPIQASIALDVIPLATGGACDELYIENTATTHVYQTTPQGGGAVQTSPNSSAPLFAATGSDITQARSPLGNFSLNLNNGGISGNLFAPAQVTFTIDVCNPASNTSAPFIDSDLEFKYQGIMINGQTMFPDFVDVTGGVVTEFSPMTGTVKLNLGAMLPGDCSTATITLFVPAGIIDLESVKIEAGVVGIDENCGAVTARTSKAIPVTAVPIVQVYKDDVLNVIASGSQIEYDIYYRNVGESPSTNTWIVDRIPFKTTFVEAKGMNGEEVWFTNKLPPSMPSNQISVLNPIDFSVISANFSLGILNDNGTPSVYTDDIWMSPFGDQTTWVAFKVDDPTLTPNQLPVDINFRKTTFVVQNDEDGTGPNTAGSPDGTIIFNEEVIFSDQNLMAVGNEVRTTVEDFPGLVLQKSSSEEVVNTGQAFDWIIDYRNNSESKDDIVTITDNLPVGFTLNSVSHEWNAVAGGGGISDISGDTNVIITNNPDGTTKVELRIAGSPGLRGDLLSDEGGTIYLNVQAQSEIPCGALVFNEVVGYSTNAGGEAVVSDDDPVTIFNPDVYLTKSVSNEEPKVGDILTYTLSFGNRSIIQAPGVIIRDTLPAGFTYVAGSSNILSFTTTVSEPTVSGNVLVWNDITVTGNAPGVLPAQYNNNYLTYEVEVAGTNGQSYMNMAGISTTSPEKQEFPNNDSVTVYVPNPDPTILKTGPAVAAAGESVVWELLYLNKRNADAQDVYIIESLPDANGNGADVTFTSATPQGPGTVTTYYTATPGTAPTFDPNNPTSGGWSASPTSPVNHIAFSVGTLPAKDGPFTILVMATLVDAIDGSFPVPGTQFLNKTEIFTSSIDEDSTNNTDEVITRTPGIDLAITKVGSVEGEFPGLRPGDEFTYTLNIINTGTIDAYGVRLEDVLPTNFIPDADNFDNFTIAEVMDASGAALSMLDLSGNPVAFNVPVTRTGTPAPGATMTWHLGTNGGTGDVDNYRNLAIPSGGQLSFVISGSISTEALDGDQASNSVTVFYDGQPGNTTPEEFLSNNVDTSEVRIWRPDVTIKKSVINESDNSETWTESGDILVYNLEYNNIGNADADNTCIQEIIPNGTSYVPGSLTVPPGATVEFSPNATTPTNFEVCIPVLPAPPNFDGESAPYSGTPVAADPFDGTDSESIACADRIDDLFEPVVLFEGGGPNARAHTAGDFDGDGDIDFATGSDGNVYLNDGAANFTRTVAFPGAGTVHFMRSGDFDNDGDIDIITGGNMTSLMYWENDGAANFTRNTTDFNLAIGGFDMLEVADWNGDGNLDIFAAGYSVGNVVRLGNGDGTFTNGATVFNSGRNYAMEFGDFNADGFLDAVNVRRGGSVTASFGNAAGGFVNGVTLGANANSHYAVAAGDINGDGYDDIVAFDAGIQISNGDGTFTPGSAIPNPVVEIQDIVLEDFDLDGDLDMLGQHWRNSEGLKYWQNDGAGNFTEIANEFVDVLNYWQYMITPADFDGDGDLDIVTGSSTSTKYFENNASTPYKVNSYYETPVNTGTISSWDRFLIDQTTEEGASITYALYAETADDDGNVLNDTPLWGPQTLEEGFADISTIPATNSNLVLRAQFTSDGTSKACLHNWTATYISPDIPSLEFKVQVNTPAPTGQTTIDNAVTITTSTPEIRTNNNDSEDNINIRLTDLAIIKSVDKSAVQAPNDETITYTLDWEVLGPQSAINATVQDVLPTNVSYQSAVPTPTSVGMTASGQDILTWDLGAELNVGTTGSIVVTTQETSAVIGDNLINVTSIDNDRQETDYENNNDEVLTVVGDFANVYIEKYGSDVVDINQTGQYQFSYGNNGNIAADNVMISDALPAGFTPIMTNNSMCNVSGQNVNCNLGTLAVGATGTITVDFQVANDPSLIGQTLLNVARIETTTPETDISDNVDDHEIPVFLLELAAISGTVWHDDNRDGVIDATEAGIESVMIILTGLDIFNNPVQDTTFTDANGEYTFPGLTPGTYNLEEVQPEGWLTITTTGSDAVTNVGDIVETSTSPQTTRTDEGTVGNGSANSGNEAFNTIILNGGDRGVEYNFGEDLGLLGDVVYIDYNIDGIQDTSEPPLANVAVNLYQDKDMDGILNPALDSLVGTTFTNTLGMYLFEDLVADNYFIDFDLTTLPDSVNLVTLQNAGSDDANDSDANPTTGQTELITLPEGAEDLTWDMGVYGDLLIGNYVWLDSNKDGIQDSGESPLAGVNITLFSTTGMSLATVQTDANGLYYFNSDTLANAGLPAADAVLRANTEYYIVVGTGGQFDSNTGALQYNSDYYQLTIDSIGTMQTDSDAELANGLGLGFDGLPFTLIMTPSFGQADTTFDFGFTTAAYDYGDLPDSGVGTSTGNYQTSISDNGPSHLIVPGLLLGAAIDDETDGQQDAEATGDDTADGNDDEDGLTLPGTFAPGGTGEIVIAATNTTGEDAFVSVWIDWNNDGDFDDADELIISEGDSGSGFTGTHTVTAPNDMASGNAVGVRVRLSNQRNLQPNGPSNSGEVEDYMITLGSFDYPNVNSPCGNPPCHIVNNDIYLGTGIMSETTPGQNGADSDIDDGLLLGNSFNAAPGSNVHFPVSIYNNTGQTAYLYGWADWNGNGDFEDAGEQFVAATYDAATFNGAFIVHVPVTIPLNVQQTGPIAVRLRLTSDDTVLNSPCGTTTCASNGEVEDYSIQLQCPAKQCAPVQLNTMSGN